MIIVVCLNWKEREVGWKRLRVYQMADYIVVYMLFARGSGGTLNAVDGKKRWVVVGIVLR